MAKQRELLIRWDRVPREVRLAARPLLKQYLWLLPTWCHSLNVGWSAEHKDGPIVTASSDADPAYRSAVLSLHGPWLDMESHRRNDIIHELLHIAIAPLVKVHESDIERLFADAAAPTFKAKIEDEHRHRYEECVCDLAASVELVDPAALPRIRFHEEII